MTNPQRSHAAPRMRHAAVGGDRARHRCHQLAYDRVGWPGSGHGVHLVAASQMGSVSFLLADSCNKGAGNGHADRALDLRSRPSDATQNLRRAQPAVGARMSSSVAVSSSTLTGLVKKR